MLLRCCIEVYFCPRYHETVLKKLTTRHTNIRSKRFDRPVCKTLNRSRGSSTIFQLVRRDEYYNVLVNGYNKQKCFLSEVRIVVTLGCRFFTKIEARTFIEYS